MPQRQAAQVQAAFADEDTGLSSKKANSTLPGARSNLCSGNAG
jgi:hypothetical protein